MVFAKAGITKKALETLKGVEYYSLKCDKLYICEYKTPRELRQIVHKYVAEYNTLRPHEALNYKTRQWYTLPVSRNRSPDPLNKPGVIRNAGGRGEAYRARRKSPPPLPPDPYLPFRLSPCQKEKIYSAIGILSSP